MSLFRLGKFKLHGGQSSDFKIDCDGLTSEDWEALAAQIAGRCSFTKVIGVPRGGLELASYLEQYRKSFTEEILLVDDVLTTGKSMEEAKKKIAGVVIGYVVFARGPLPVWVNALFKMPGVL